jgi:hypothetical protein
MWRILRRRRRGENSKLKRLREVAAQGEKELEQRKWRGTRNTGRRIEQSAVDCAIAGESSDAMRREMVSLIFISTFFFPSLFSIGFASISLIFG